MGIWNEARNALPIAVRKQYSGCLRMAARLEPAFDAAIEAWGWMQKSIDTTLRRARGAFAAGNNSTALKN